MCRFISFFHNPKTGDLAVKDLNSHGETEMALNLNLKVWREAHYTPNGNIELRFNEGDEIPENYKEHFKEKFPTFSSFFNYCIMSTGQDKVFPGSLDLRGLTSAKGLVLPKEVGSLDLRGLTSEERSELRIKYPTLLIS